MIDKIITPRIVNIFLLCLIIMLNQPLIAQIPLQSYPKGKIILKTSQVLEGKQLKIYLKKAVLSINNTSQIFNLSDIQQIMAKEGKGHKWGSRSSAGCVAFYLLSTLLSGDEDEDVQTDRNNFKLEPTEKLAFAAIGAGIFYGVGYYLGNLSDDWEVIYSGE